MTRNALLTLILSFVVASGIMITLVVGVSLLESSPDGTVKDDSATNATVEYTLITGGRTGHLVFVGVGGEIDGEINPLLIATPGDVVKITLINGDGMQHDVVIDEFNVRSALLSLLDERESITFTVTQTGEFVYYCSVPGHRQAGMWGKLVVSADNRWFRLF